MAAGPWRSYEPVRVRSRNCGYTTTLVAVLAEHIRRRGKEPFGHVVGENTSALRLYEELGCEVRRAVHATEAVPVSAPR